MINFSDLGQIVEKLKEEGQDITQWIKPVAKATGRDLQNIIEESKPVARATGHDFKNIIEWIKPVAKATGSDLNILARALLEGTKVALKDWPMILKGRAQSSAASTPTRHEPSYSMLEEQYKRAQAKYGKDNVNAITIRGDQVTFSNKLLPDEEGTVSTPVHKPKGVVDVQATIQGLQKKQVLRRAALSSLDPALLQIAGINRDTAIKERGIEDIKSTPAYMRLPAAKQELVGEMLKRSGPATMREYRVAFGLPEQPETTLDKITADELELFNPTNKMAERINLIQINKIAEEIAKEKIDKATTKTKEPIQNLEALLSGLTGVSPMTKSILNAGLQSNEPSPQIDRRQELMNQIITAFQNGQITQQQRDQLITEIDRG